MTGELSAHTLALTLTTAATELAKLRPFLDDLDGWNSHDCDTGTNALLTVESMSRLAPTDPDMPLADYLDTLVSEGIRTGHGHVGLLITALWSAWAHALRQESGADLNPIIVRRMLTSAPWDAPDAHVNVAPALAAMFDEATSELEVLGATVPDQSDLVSLYSSQLQYGLINATDDYIDAGAAALIVIAASLDCTMRNDPAILDSLARMMSDLAHSHSRLVSTAARPRDAFNVDMIVAGSTDDATNAGDYLDALEARWAAVGATDLFAYGTWRFRIDTSAPLAVRPPHGTVTRFMVRDGRPDELIGVDTLSDGVTHRGAQLLERRTHQRIERATVIAMTHAPGLVEDLAQAGALTLLDPNDQDIEAITCALAHSSTGVSLIAACDSASRARAERIRDVSPHTVIVAPCEDDLTALECTRACASAFVPQPGGPTVAPVMQTMLTQSAARAAAASFALAITYDADEQLPLAVREVKARAPRRVRLLIGAADGPNLTATVRQMLAPDINELEVIDGGQAGPSIIQGLTV